MVNNEFGYFFAPSTQEVRALGIPPLKQELGEGWLLKISFHGSTFPMEKAREMELNAIPLPPKWGSLPFQELLVDVRWLIAGKGAFAACGDCGVVTWPFASARRGRPVPFYLFFFGWEGSLTKID